MANDDVPDKIWRHVGGEGDHKYLDDMTAKELADQEAEHRSDDPIAQADAARYQKCFEYHEQHTCPDHPEITLPGVHSDLGAEHRTRMQEELMVTPLQSLEVALELGHPLWQLVRSLESLHGQYPWCCISDGSLRTNN